MKRSDITPKIIELSKEIAKYWKMEIYEGCWIYVAHEMFLIKIPSIIKERNWNFIPIPSIADCLRKLRKLEQEGTIQKGKTKHDEATNPLLDYILGMTSLTELHEVLLFALLEVLKKEKGE